MNSNMRNQLEQAKLHFEAFRLREAYKILKRYYDRLPFAPEESHGQFIGMFARTLVELGKDFDLYFYVNELERAYEKRPAAYIGYPLAMLYSYLSEPRWDSARRILERIISDGLAGEYRIKAKMLLTFYYERNGDTAACRALIESIREKPKDPVVLSIYWIWKAAMASSDKKFGVALKILENLLDTPTARQNWYVFFSAQIELADLYVQTQNLDGANRIVCEIQRYFEGRPSKSIQLQMAGLLEKISRKAVRKRVRRLGFQKGKSLRSLSESQA